MTAVTRLSTIAISIPLEAPKGGSGHPLGPTFLTHCLVKAETDSGVTGYGEISDGWGCEYAHVADAIVTEALSRFVVGRDPREIDAIVRRAWAWLRRRQGTTWLVAQAMSGVETALWDCGEAPDRPVYALLGATALRYLVGSGNSYRRRSGRSYAARRASAESGVRGAKVRSVRMGGRDRDARGPAKNDRSEDRAVIDGNRRHAEDGAVAPARRYRIGFFESPAARRSCRACRARRGLAGADRIRGTRLRRRGFSRARG